MAPTLLTVLLLAPVPIDRPGPTFTVTVRFEGKPAAGVTVWPFGTGHAVGRCRTGRAVEVGERR